MKDGKSLFFDRPFVISIQHERKTFKLGFKDKKFKGTSNILKNIKYPPKDSIPIAPSEIDSSKEIAKE
jgi:hypothetical protein